MAVADIVIDADNSAGSLNTIIAPASHNQGAFTDNAGDAIEVNDSNGVNGTLTISGTVTSVGNGLHILNNAELAAFANGDIVESSGAGTAAFYLQEDQDNAITNAGTIRNTSSGYGLWIDTEAQTQDFINSGTISSATGIAINADTAMSGFDNSGTIERIGGTAIDAEAAFKLTNSDTITGHIDHATSGALTINQTAGTITGNITSTSNAAHSLSLTGGSITGNITLMVRQLIPSCLMVQRLMAMLI